MTGPEGDESVIAFEVIDPVWQDDRRSHPRPVVVEGGHDRLGVERAWTVEIADHLFFFVSTLSIGLGVAAYSALNCAILVNCSSRCATVSTDCRFCALRRT